MTDNNTESRDALDILRSWVRLQDISFGSLKPKLTIENGVVVQALVRRGDEEIQLRKDTVLKTNSYREEKKPHF